MVRVFVFDLKWKFPVSYWNCGDSNVHKDPQEAYAASNCN